MGRAGLVCGLIIENSPEKLEAHVVTNEDLDGHVSRAELFSNGQISNIGFRLKSPPNRSRCRFRRRRFGGEQSLCELRQIIKINYSVVIFLLKRIANVSGVFLKVIPV